MRRFICSIATLIMAISLSQCTKGEVKTGIVKEVTEKGTVIVDTGHGDKADKEILDNYKGVLKAGDTVYYFDKGKEGTEITIRALSNSLLGDSYEGENLAVINIPTYTQLKELGNIKVYVSSFENYDSDYVNTLMSSPANHKYNVGNITEVDFDYLYLGEDKVEIDNIVHLIYKYK